MSDSSLDYDKIISLLKSSGALVIDSAREALQEIVNDKINKEVEESIKFERKRQAKLVTWVLLKEGISKERIVELLHQEWLVEESEVEEIIDKYVTITIPIRAINDYLKEKGYGLSFIKEFVKNNNVEEQLNNNPSLRDLATKPELLIQAVSTPNK